MPTLSVVVPVYNEEGTVRQLLARVLNHARVHEVVAVDDASTDTSASVLREMEEEHRPRLRVVYQAKNQGKGAALRAGFGVVSGSHVIVQDADLEYDPNDYGKLLDEVETGEADVVYGSRFLWQPIRSIHTFGNRVLTWISNLTTGKHLTDMETCYKLFPREVIQNLPLRSNRFGFEPEVTAKISRLRLRITEVPISYSARSHQEGKKIGWRDAVSAVMIMLKYMILDDVRKKKGPGRSRAPLKG